MHDIFSNGTGAWLQSCPPAPHDLSSLCSTELRHCLVDCWVLVVVWRCTPPFALCPTRMSHSQPHGWVTPSSCFGRLFGRRACRIVEGGRRRPGANGADRVTEGPRQSCARCWQDWGESRGRCGVLIHFAGLLAQSTVEELDVLCADETDPCARPLKHFWASMRAGI